MEAESQATNERHQNNYVLPSESFLWLLMTTAISARVETHLAFLSYNCRQLLLSCRHFRSLVENTSFIAMTKSLFLLFATRLWNEGCDSRRPISHVIDSLPTEIKEKRAMKYRRWTHSHSWTQINQTCNVKAHPQDEQISTVTDS